MCFWKNSLRLKAVLYGFMQRRATEEHSINFRCRMAEWWQDLWIPYMHLTYAHRISHLFCWSENLSLWQSYLSGWDFNSNLIHFIDPSSVQLVSTYVWHINRMCALPLTQSPYPGFSCDAWYVFYFGVSCLKFEWSVSNDARRDNLCFTAMHTAIQNHSQSYAEATLKQLICM